jgi:hypothetical protein
MIAAAVQDVTESIPGFENLNLRPSSTWQEILLIVGVSLAVGLLCLVGYLIFRKKPGDIVRSRSSSDGSYSGGFLFGGKKRRRRRHHRHEEFETRNPTRAEVGGFPELRDDPAEAPNNDPFRS